VFGDHARDQAPLVGNEQVVLQASQVLDAETTRSLKTLQVSGR
jgi:hypothetical protein